jgi:hypothetical protein
MCRFADDVEEYKEKSLVTVLRMEILTSKEASFSS